MSTNTSEFNLNLNGLVTELNELKKKPRNIGEIIYSMTPLNDSGVHLLDGSLISGNGMYEGFYNYVANLYNSMPTTGNVTKVGSLVDTDGVLSGFSSTSWAVLPNNFSPNSANWEIVIRFNTGTLGALKAIVNTSSVAYQPIAFGVAASGKLYINSFLNNTETRVFAELIGNTTLNSNTWYYVKVIYDSNVGYSISLSTDGITYTTEASNTVKTVINSGRNIALGADFQANGAYLNGTFGDGQIDLSNSYINIGGERWWTGAKKSGFIEELQHRSSVSTYGVCGKFVLDTINKTVRLPKISGFTEATFEDSALGVITRAGLPNITGSMWSASATLQEFADDINSYGAFKTETDGYSRLAILNSDGEYHTPLAGVSFDASRSSALYGRSSTVQPQSTKVLIYIVIANTVKTEVEVDISEISSDLALKADRDLANLSNSGKNIIAHMGLPSSKKITVGVTGSSMTYTAPSDGWLVGYCHRSGQVNSISILVQGFQSDTSIAPTGGWYTYAMIPVKENDVASIAFYSGDGTFDARGLWFIYAEGSKHLAPQS